MFVSLICIYYKLCLQQLPLRKENVSPHYVIKEEGKE